MSTPPAGPDRQTVLVTGATSGIGKAAATLLARSGYRVFGTSRHLERSRGDGYDLVPLDVTSEESAAACVRAVADATGGRLDVLVNNVGTGVIGAVEEVSDAEAKAVFEANFFGLARMTRLALPLMRARRAGLIVNMSSAGGVMGVPFAAYYCATKFAIEGFTQSLRHEVRPLGVWAVVVAPGAVSTPAGDSAARAAGRVADYSAARDRLDASFTQGIRGSMSPDRVARTILRIVRTPKPSPRYKVGAQSFGASVAKSLLPEGAFESLVRGALRLGGK